MTSYGGKNKVIADHSAIVARGMGVRRGGRWLLRPVTFGLSEGVVGLSGPPGAGKSTLLATFATLRRPNAGILRILGHDTGNSAELRAVRARIGYLPRRFARAQNMTVGEFVAYAAYYKRVGAAEARSVLKRLDLAEAAGTELALLPPDVRLRAGLAAACAHEPDLLLLDDPLGELCATAAPWPTGAASQGGHACGAALAELVPLLRTLAPTVVISGEATEALTGWCDRLLTLSRGRLTEMPTHSATVRRGRGPDDRRVPARTAVREGRPSLAEPVPARTEPAALRADPATTRPDLTALPHPDATRPEPAALPPRPGAIRPDPASRPRPEPAVLPPRLEPIWTEPAASPSEPAARRARPGATRADPVAHRCGAGAPAEPGEACRSRGAAGWGAVRLGLPRLVLAGVRGRRAPAGSGAGV
ncbi:ATP-binding cassette domain-containing protein [Spirillospora albida]|uniref:ATP-binding cassette domain-containing protein n=1 Tax=Spirillospora albida TaxID=58123 RepID=UPI001FDEC503|nr:ATP-binding cassette domain-containing protein [Spirillospora albida]